MCKIIIGSMRTAEEDFDVYKLFKYENKAYYGYYHGTRGGRRSYLKDYNTPTKLTTYRVFANCSERTERGYYSFSKLDVDEIAYRGPMTRIVKFTIPKGTKYYKCENETIVAERMVNPKCIGR